MLTSNNNGFDLYLIRHLSTSFFRLFVRNGFCYRDWCIGGNNVCQSSPEIWANCEQELILILSRRRFSTFICEPIFLVAFVPLCLMPLWQLESTGEMTAMMDEIKVEEFGQVFSIDALIERLLDYGDRTESNRGGLVNSIILLLIILSLVVIGFAAMIWQFLTISPSARRKRDRQVEALEHPVHRLEEEQSFPSGKVDPTSATLGVDAAPTIQVACGPE
jgi:hypothetical protein